MKLTTFGPVKTGQLTGRKLIVQTARSAGHEYARRGGYCIRIEPPLTYETNGMDVEGIGWWPHPPRKHTQHFNGWYKHKAAAISRAVALVG